MLWKDLLLPSSGYENDSLFYLEDDGRRLIRNVVTYLPNYIVAG
jgi:hypothetical protein